MRALLLLVSLLLALCAAEEGGSAPQPRLRPAFSTRLSTYSIKTAAEKLGRRDWSELTQGNKIVLPQRVLSQLQDRSLPYTQFQICNPECKQQRLYTGPLDFCAADGECYLPAWMMRQLKLKEGGTLSVATAQFPSGVFARFQPHSSDFLDVSNHYYLLLKTLDHFACLTAGSTIRVTDGSRTHLLDVLEVRGKPGQSDASRGRAIDLTMVELEVDIRPPKDQQPKKPAARPQPEAADAADGAGDAAGDGDAAPAADEAAASGQEEAAAPVAAAAAAMPARSTARSGAAAAKASGRPAVAKSGAAAAAKPRARTAAAASAAPRAVAAAKPAAGRRLADADDGGAAKGEEEGGEGGSVDAEPPLAEASTPSSAVLRAVRQLLAMVVAVLRSVLRLLLSPSSKGTAATQLG